MESTAEADVLLDGLAGRFEDAARDAYKGASGWGQFLDGSVQHEQIGVYGTSAGIIVRALAGRGVSSLTDQVQLTEGWWGERGPGQSAYDDFCQIPRLAFFHLAMRLASQRDAFLEEVAQELLGRLLPSDMWGNFYSSSEIFDETPRLFPSSIALLSFALFRTEATPISDRLIAVANQLERKIAGSDRLPLLHIAAASAAILWTKGASVDKRVWRKISSLAYVDTGDPNLGDLGVYFYEYRYQNGYDRHKFGRDYFIVPTELLVALAGYHRAAPSALRHRADRIYRALQSNLKTSVGAFKPDVEQRISSKNQAWAALVLHASNFYRGRKTLVTKAWYELRRRRDDNWFTGWVFPFVALVVTTAANVLLGESGPWHKVFAAISLLVVGSLYAQFFRRMLTET